MKRSAIAALTGAALALCLGEGASAANLTVNAAPPPAPNWTGFYVGVHGGAAWQSNPKWNLFDPNAAAGLTTNMVNQPVISAARNNAGAVGGIQGGYNWQFAPDWVLGIEGDISWASLADHRTSPLYASGFGGTTPGVPFGPGTSVAMSANTEWLSSVRGKFGFVGWSTLWYVTGGAAWANVEYSATTSLIAGIATPEFSNTSFNRTQSGWVLGGGAEWQATSNILLRAEYLYYQINANVSASAPFAPATALIPLAEVYTWANYNVQVARVAASYRF
jgi:outer membrane immunogenic protein